MVGSRGRRIGFYLLVAFVAAALASSVVGIAAGSGLPLMGTLVLQVVLVLAGALLWGQSETRRHGQALLLAAVLIGVAALENNASGHSATYALQIGWTLRWASAPVLAWVLLTYPEPRLRHRSQRFLIALLTVCIAVRVTASLLWVPAVGPDGPSPAKWWTLYPAGDLSQALVNAQAYALAVVMVWFVGAQVRRWQAARGAGRVPVRLVVVAAVLLGVGLPLRELAPIGVDLGWLPPGADFVITAVQTSGAGAAGLVLVALALRTAARRGFVVENLLAAGTEPDRVEAVLRTVLRDPTLRLCWDPVTPDEEPDTEHAATAERVRQVLTAEDGQVVAVVDADRQVLQDPAGLRITLAAASVVLHNTHLTRERAQHLAEVRASRTRIVQAGVEQRRQLERDLHDGAQQSLLAVATTLARASVATDPEHVHAVVADAQHQLSDALAEVRRLARGIHPPALSQGGLGAALRALTAGTAVNLQLGADVEAGRRFPAAIETTAYFVVTEAVANAVKHAPGQQVTVRVDADDEHVDLRIDDRGPGGAHLSPGGGLRGLRDRVRALDGTFELTSTTMGTVVHVVLPRPEPEPVAAP